MLLPHKVHVWVGATYGGRDLPRDTPPVPAHLDWELWLGPVPTRPYHPDFAPVGWRNWWHFGGGSLADFGCHFMDLPFWALDLRHPTTIEAEGPPVHPDSTPPWLIVRYGLPERIHAGAKWPPLRLAWYHGGKYPEAQITTEQHQKWRNSILFTGTRGQLLADHSRHVLLPEADFAEFVKPRPFIKDSLGHHRERIEAIRPGGTTTCAFDYSGPLTEAALLGNVAGRVGRKLEWDAAAMKAPNCPKPKCFSTTNIARAGSSERTAGRGAVRCASSRRTRGGSAKAERRGPPFLRLPVSPPSSPRSAVVPASQDLGFRPPGRGVAPGAGCGQLSGGLENYLGGSPRFWH